MPKKPTPKNKKNQKTSPTKKLSNLSSTAQSLVILVVALVVGAGVIFGMWLNRPETTPQRQVADSFFKAVDACKAETAAKYAPTLLANTDFAAADKSCQTSTTTYVKQLSSTTSKTGSEVDYQYSTLEGSTKVQVELIVQKNASTQNIWQVTSLFALPDTSAPTATTAPAASTPAY